MTIYIWIYRIIIFLYRIILNLIAPFHFKARQMILGRKNIFDKLAKDFPRKEMVIWFHCASLGEYLQAVPLMSILKKKKSACLLITFFSPSGYMGVQKDNIPDFVYYLPFDSPQHAKQFLRLVQPQYIFFVKYDLWYFYLYEAHRSSADVFLINGFFHVQHIFFKWYGVFFIKMLHFFTHIFVQEEGSKHLLSSIGIHKVSVVGNTKYDYVYECAQTLKKIPYIKQFKAGHKLVIIGSSWPEDITLLLPLIMEKNNLKWIIVPHVVGERQIISLQKMLKKPAVRYSILHNIDNYMQYDILILDCIGLLFAIYSYADFVYVGGGMKQGLHNILEPAIFNIPLFFGYKAYYSCPEAHEFIDLGVAFPIHSAQEMSLIIQNKLYLYRNIKNSFLKRIGGSQKIIQKIF